MVKDGEKTTMRNAKAKNKALLDHLVYTVMAIEVDDPMDKLIKSKTCTIRKPADLISLSEEEIKDLKYLGGDDDKTPTPLNTDECAKIRQLQKYIQYLKDKNNSNKIDYTAIQEEDFDDFRTSNQGQLLLPPTTAPIGINRSNTSPTIPAKSKYTPAENWEKGIKRDPNLFPTIKRDADWKDFSDKMILEAKSQLTYDVLDPTYTPANQQEQDIFVLKQNYMMSVFKTHILMDQGKSIIAIHTATGRAQQVWKELETYHKKSTQAENVCEILLNYIVT